ncbi:hypothetical protein D3C76_1412060 [compost metagenome]
MDTGRPFADQMETTSLRAVELKNALIDLQGGALSRRTPLNELFATYDPFTDSWEDFGDTFDENTDRLKAHVLKVTNRKTLDEARDSFKNDSLVRLAVQLSNADSLTWLITHLGRELHVTTP